MDNKAAMQQTQGIGFMHNIRLVPYFPLSSPAFWCYLP